MTRLSLAALLALVGCIAIGIYRSRWVLTFDGKPCGWAWPWETELSVPLRDRWTVWTASRSARCAEEYSLNLRLNDPAGASGGVVEIPVHVQQRKQSVFVDWFLGKTNDGCNRHPRLVYPGGTSAIFQLEPDERVPPPVGSGYLGL